MVFLFIKLNSFRFVHWVFELDNARLELVVSLAHGLELSLLELDVAEQLLVLLPESELGGFVG